MFDCAGLNKDPLVFVLGFLGWTIPANIGVSAFGGNSLFGSFTQSIGENLARFPQGPPLTDKFWCAQLSAAVCHHTVQVSATSILLTHTDRAGCCS